MSRSLPRAIVIGGSMGGLFAGLLLRRAGWDAQIYERGASELSARGAGIVTHPELVAALLAAGAEPSHDLGVLIEERRTFDRSGSVIEAYACPQTATSWNRMLQMLREQFPDDRYHLGKELVRIEPREHTAVARFGDGSVAEAELIVGADGLRSTVRRQFLPEVGPVYAGYVAWRGLVEESALSPAVHREIFPYFTFCLPPGEQMLGYPVAGADDDVRPGHRRYNFVWYRPADEATGLPWLLTDESGKRHRLSIPPPLISRSAIAEMRAHCEEVLAPQFRELVRLTDQPFLQPIYDLESPSMAFPHVAMIGDAAFVARPHVGGGVAKAALDAVALVDALSHEHDIQTALVRFEAERLEVGRRIVDQSRRLGSYMRTHFDTPEQRALAERHQTPRAVMSETALLDFLRG